MTTQRVTIHGPNLMVPGPTFHVHAEGCADLRKRLYRGADGGWTVEATSQQDVVEEIYQDIMAENEGDLASWEAYADDVRIFPCVALPEVTA